MEQIAAAADVAKGTLYNHFPVKEALIRHRMHADLAVRMPALLAATSVEASCALLRALFHAAGYAVRSREFLPQYIHYRLSQPLAELGGDQRSGLDRVFEQLLGEGQAKGEIERRFPAALLAGHLQFMHLSTLLRWLGDPEVQLAEAFDDMLDLFLHGCLADKAP